MRFFFLLLCPSHPAECHAAGSSAAFLGSLRMVNVRGRGVPRALQTRARRPRHLPLALRTLGNGRPLVRRLCATRYKSCEYTAAKSLHRCNSHIDNSSHATMARHTLLVTGIAHSACTQPCHQAGGQGHGTARSRVHAGEQAASGSARCHWWCRQQHVKQEIAEDIKAPCVIYTYGLSPFSTEAVALLEAKGAKFESRNWARSGSCWDPKLPSSAPSSRR